LTKALRDAGFDVAYSMREDTKTPRYLPTRMDPASSYLASSQSWLRSTGSRGAVIYDDDPQRAAAARAEERLVASARRDGFRVLTVRQGLSPRAVQKLVGEVRASVGARAGAAAAGVRSGVAGAGTGAAGAGSGAANAGSPAGSLAGAVIGAEALSVTGLFLEEMHALIAPGTKPTWETILRADAAAEGRSAMKFAEFARTAWGAVEPRVRALMDERAGAGPLLLTDAAVFARYDAMGVLDRLAETSRSGGCGLWLLVPQEDPARPPRLGSVAVPYQAALGEWIELPDAWIRGAHLGAADVVGV
jgi:hypothetical protein